MLRELWKFISNLGIAERLSPFDQKAIMLMNQVSFVMMIWFTVFSLAGLVNIKPVEFLINAINVLLFGIVLILNGRGLTTLSRHYFSIYGLSMVTAVNILFDASFFPMVQFITTVIFPVLIFRKRRTAFLYLALNIVSLVFIMVYHNNYQPLVEPPEGAAFSAAYGLVFIVMIVVFLVSLFFRNIGDDLERKLVEKNRYLNELVEKMQNMQEQMISSEKMASLGQLTAGIAHEINNPINFVSSNISPLKRDLEELKTLCLRYKDLLEPGGRLEEKLRDMESLTKEIDPEFLYQEIETLIRGVEEGAERTKEIVLGLRSFSRMDEDEFKESDLHVGLDSTLMLLKNKIKHRIEVKKNFGNIPMVECIPGKINQVLMNILNNASDAIADKGTITITTTRKQDNVVLSIRDDGIGMAESVKRRVFEPFYTTKAIGQGTGLGLSISYGIVEKHHGKIEIKSEPGKGSEFIITLPVKQPDKEKKRGKKGF